MHGPELCRLLRSGRAPSDLVVERALSLAGTRVRRLPADLTVRGDLDLRQCERLRAIGKGLTVQGDLRIGGTCAEADVAADALDAFGASRDRHAPLEALPEHLTVAGSLTLARCVRVRELPESARVGGSITFVGCTSLARLPKGLRVAGDLTIVGGPALAELPEGLVVERDLRIVGTQIAALPMDLQVGRHLYLVGCRRLASLEGVAPGGDLEVHHFVGDALPHALAIHGSLHLVQPRALVETPRDLWAGGSVEVRRATALAAVNPGIVVGKSLVLRGCDKLVRLPPDLTIPGRLDLSGCSALPALPRRLRAQRLFLEGCEALASVPSDLAVVEPIEVSGTRLRAWPEALAEKPVAWRGVRVLPRVVFAPETLRPEEILGTTNAELRRVMLERAGIDRVLTAASARLVDSDRDPGGDRSLFEVMLPGPAWRNRGAPIAARFLACSCPSTGRRYLLRVATTVGTCHGAAAWLAGFENPALYRPIQET